MIKFLTAVLMFFIDIFMLIVIFCAIVLALIMVDYILDTDIKTALNKWLGPRKGLKDIRKNVLKLFDKIDREEYEKEARWR